MLLLQIILLGRGESKQPTSSFPSVARKRTPHRFGRLSFAAVCMLGAFAFASSEAFAVCAPAAGPTVTCSGATLNQGPELNTGFGTGLQNGLTINVQAPASVTGTSIGIDVGGNNTINNLGTITTAGSGGIGDVYGINANGNNLTVTNSGTIGRLDIPNNLIDTAGINVQGTGLSVTNNQGATIQGATGIQGVGLGTVVNSGLINGGGGADGINFFANNTSMVMAINNSTGVIKGDANGINASSAVVFNFGTISGAGGSGINADTLVLTNYASGLVTGGSAGVSGSTTPTLTITNFGKISSTGLGGDGVLGHTVNIVNSGTISSAAGTFGNAIAMASGSVTNNAGGLISSDGPAISAVGNTSIFNAGTITGSGGTALAFSSGGNTLTLGPGSIINGTAQGFGADTFQLGGTGTDSLNASLFATQYTGYTTFNKIGASTWTLTGTGGNQAWNINGGTLVAGHQTAGFIDALGTGDITMGGGTLRAAVTGTFNNNLVFSNNTSSVVSAAAGQTVTFGPNGGTSFVTFGDNSVATFGSATDTGTVVISSGFNNIFATAQVVVADGTLRDGNGTLGNALSFIESTTVNAGAALDMNDQVPVIHNLLGAGTVITGKSALTTLFLLNGEQNGTFSSHLFSGVIRGPGSVEIGPVTPAGGETILSGTNTYTGGTFVQDTSILQLGNGGTTGSILGNVTFRQLGINGPNPAMLIFDRSNSYQFDGAISGPGNVTQAGTGTTILTANNSYTGTTAVNAGTLIVDGSIASSSLTTVSAGATLGGNGTVGKTAINGGTLTPGSAAGSAFGPLTVQGSLSFTAASTYMIQVSPANAGRTNVTGTATLGGATVNAVFMPGSYVNRQYIIVNATGGVSGTFNPTVISNSANLQSTLSYDAKDAFLNIKLVFVAPGGLNGNQQNVANTLTNFFNTTGGIPAAFAMLGSAGLTQASGELPTGSQQTTFDAMNLFLGLLTDPFVAGRGDPVTSPTGAPQFAEQDDGVSAYALDGKPRSKRERDAYAAIYRKALPPPLDPFTQRWSVWAAGYGGSQTTDGNAVLGSNATSSSVYGAAVGADYRFSPSTLAGFALAGGGTNFSIANALGTGRSDLFQAGAFVRHTVGPAYLSAALAYGWQDITTDRTVTIAGIDQLRAKFNANAWSGRVEGGYRFVTPWIGGVGITPYAAGQFTTFSLPNYAEAVVSGANTFALSYAARDVTASRSELGVRTDKSYAMQNGILTLRGRFAWAHDFNTDRNIAATFQTLPGASFVVGGAAQAHDAALTTASTEMKWQNGFSLAGTFEGEFSNVTRSYAGKGVVRYAW